MNLITENDILDEAKDCFLTYASEVLTDRAIPAAEDGLLSAQRKILWTMMDYLKMTSKGKTKKCQGIVGSTLATSYFHGDQSCYGVLCKLSQPYLMRYPLIIGQGSLGTQADNDLVASARYTEAKPSPYAELMMEDFKKNVVPLKETYNGEFMEPVVLPSLFPNAICNGRQAIGISMSHSTPPHNLGEVCDAIVAYLNNNNLTIDELLDIMPGPDFPLSNTIINKKDVRAAYATGRSVVSLKVRGEYEIKGQNLIFTTIPYRAYRNKIKEQIEKNIDELEKYIEDFDDESNLGQNRLVFKCKKDVAPAAVAEKLFALTDLQTTVSYNMNYVVNGTPKMCSMLDLIKEYCIHQENIIVKIAQNDKEKAEARKHIIEGLLVILDDVDTAIQIIRNSDNRKEAEQALIKKYNISEIQGKAVLDMKLARLTKLDRDDLLNELNEKINIIADCDKLINDKSYRDSKLIARVTEMKKKYADARRTTLLQIDIPKEEKENSIIPEDCIVTITKSGFIKRVPAKNIKVQKANGKGIKSSDDIVLNTISTNTIDTLMIFTDIGKMYRISVNDIPECTNAAKGTPISNIITLENKEQVIAITSLYKNTNAEYAIFITKNGMFKKTCLEEYIGGKKKSGITAIKFKDDDTLANVTFVKDEDFLIITKKGMVIHIESKSINAIGRNTIGVKAIKLSEDDEVLVGLPIHKFSDSLFLISNDGLGKKMKLSEFPVQIKGGKGLSGYRVNNTTGEVVGAALISNNDNLYLIGRPNSICVSAQDIPESSRTALGNIMIKDSKVYSIVKI